MDFQVKEWVITLIANNGETFSQIANHYNYDEGSRTLRIYNYAGSKEEVAVDGKAIRRANMDLVGIFHDIGGYWVGEAENES